ncbi:UAA transporter family-domain-containing protein [Annulohypoxylon moriforme]|nr:UAA transporter family-domain-containing protein [Annulohypoxylon moriforme]
MVEGDSNSPTWKFTQCFGDKGDVEDITEADIISTVEFDHTGNYLATGDKGGRVVLFERNETKKTCEYKFHTEFQSHEPEFDYLKSLEIEEKINKIKWCRRQNASHYLLSTNDKTIKLWKVFEKSLKVVAENNLSHDLTPGSVTGVGGGAPRSIPPSHFKNAGELKLPRLTHHDTVVAAVPRRTYANAHAYHINSISVNSDGETFISSDDLRINLWNLNIQDQSFNIVDIKPANMEELTEVITAAEFHPISCNWFMYASSKGTIKLADMRESALCDQHAKLFEQEEDPSSRSFFSEIISSISDVRFSYDGRYILSRDYLTVKIWDVNMERQPVKTIPIHEHLRPRLCDTYENDSIFDKFEVVFSGDAKNVMTGSYNNNFMIYPSDPEKEIEVVLQADKSAFKAKKVGIPTPINSSTSPTATNGGKKGGSRAGSPAAGAGQGQRMRKETDADQIDFNKKILHMSWHPFEDSIAIAATNNSREQLTGYHKRRNKSLVIITHIYPPRPTSSTSMTSRSVPRRRQTLRDSHAASRNGTAMTPKVINAGPSLEKAELYGIDDQRPTFSKIMGLAGRIFIETIPQWLAVGAMLGLIFGGCCSNVFALEAIINRTDVLQFSFLGTLLTFVQFLFVAVTGYVSQFDFTRPPFFIKPNRVPIRRWLINIVLFFSINVLNNHAFSYDISVPVHIILRSGGSITTMIAGSLYGKRYSRIQVVAVLLLTVGVVTAACAGDPREGVPKFSTGLAVLLIAQILSAIMGLYTEETYRKYGPHWKENLFYSHLLSLPLFLPFSRSLVDQFMRLANSKPLPLPLLAGQVNLSTVPATVRQRIEGIYIPSQVAYLALNVLTQYACIRGVNLLAAASSALTVTIVLNIRKLVSLLLSIWLFGNRLATGTLIGAIVVFSAGGLYSLDSKKKALPKPKTAGGKAG